MPHDAASIEHTESTVLRALRVSCLIACFVVVALQKIGQEESMPPSKGTIGSSPVIGAMAVCHFLSGRPPARCTKACISLQATDRAPGKYSLSSTVTGSCTRRLLSSALVHGCKILTGMIVLVYMQLPLCVGSHRRPECEAAPGMVIRCNILL